MVMGKESRVLKVGSEFKSLYVGNSECSSFTATCSVVHFAFNYMFVGISVYLVYGC